jgi:GT2 family glycosyltransferase
MSLPKVSIIILNWNGLQDTLECIESVFKLNYENYEIVIVDNGSSDDSAENIKKIYPTITIIKNSKNLGYTGGNNLGIRYALKNGSDYVWLLNNDTIVEKDSLKYLIKTFDTSKEVGLVSPIIYYYNAPEKIQFCGWVVDWMNCEVKEPSANEIIIKKEFIEGRDVCLWGTALVIKSDVIKKIGFLDEKYFAYWEDIDYSIKALRAGFRNVIEINSHIYHKVTEKRKPHYYYFMARNEYIMWVQYLTSFKKFTFFRKYVSKRLSQFDYLRRLGNNDCADALLDGTWCGILGTVGVWDRNVKVPSLLKILLSWKTMFWKRLFGGNYIKAFKKILNLITSKF